MVGPTQDHPAATRGRVGAVAGTISMAVGAHSVVDNFDQSKLVVVVAVVKLGQSVGREMLNQTFKL